MNVTQSRMARAALRWSWDDMAAASGVNRMTVSRFEGGLKVSDKSLDAMRAALEGAGVKFERKAARLIVSVPEV